MENSNTGRLAMGVRLLMAFAIVMILIGAIMVAVRWQLRVGVVLMAIGCTDLVIGMVLKRRT